MITKQWLKKHEACTEAYEWYLKQKDKSEEALFKACIKENHLNWANWTISKKLNKTNKIKYAIYAAKQVVYLYEQKFPNDKRPRNAIKAAERYLKNPSIKNRNSAAWAAADAARAAADAADAADAARAAEDAAWAAADAARAADATDAARAAADAADAARAAEDAADAARAEMLIKILRYGMRLYRLQIARSL